MTGAHPAGGAEAPVVPGEVLVADDPIVLFAGRPTLTVEVVNTGDRPIQVGSHYHLAEANPALAFDRAAARGWRLAIPAGTAVRFEPGIERTVTLVPLAGRRVVAGLRGEVAGALDRPSGGERDGDRPSGGERDGDRPSGGERDGDRPSGGERDGDRLSGGERPDGADR